MVSKGCWGDCSFCRISKSRCSSLLGGVAVPLLLPRILSSSAHDRRRPSSRLLSGRGGIAASISASMSSPFIVLLLLVLLSLVLLLLSDPPPPAAACCCNAGVLKLKLPSPSKAFSLLAVQSIKDRKIKEERERGYKAIGWSID